MFSPNYTFTGNRWGESIPPDNKTATMVNSTYQAFGFKELIRKIINPKNQWRFDRKNKIKN